MKKRLLTSLEIVLVLVLAFVLKTLVSSYFFDALILFISIFAALETSRLFTKMGKYNYTYLVGAMPVVLMLFTLLGINFDSEIGLSFTLLIDIAVIVLGFGLAFLFGLVNRKAGYNEMKIRKINNKSTLTKFALGKAFNTTVAFIYPAFLLSFMTILNHLDMLTSSYANVSNFAGYASLVALLFMFLIPIFTDTFAYLTGSLIGGKKLMPKVSPAKTISGAVGGVVWTVVLSICVYLIMNAITPLQLAFKDANFAVWQVAVFSFVGSFVCQFGDLFESFLKRKADVKDSGKIFPGHGGMLDRVDSYIFLAPYLLLVFAIILL